LIVQPRDNYACDACGRQFGRLTSNCCTTCNLDVCHYCAKLVQTKTENKVAHAHTLTAERAKSSWFCNLCGVKHEANRIRFGCRACDFDACAFCYFV
jgi:hypothetical protein